MGGFSVQCDCGKWFLERHSYKDHCCGKGCMYHPDRVGSFGRKPLGVFLVKVRHTGQYYRTKRGPEGPQPQFVINRKDAEKFPSAEAAQLIADRWGGCDVIPE